MDCRLELVVIPVSDVDRAIAFYRDQVGFNLDYDHKVSPELRFVQLTPKGSACSIALGTGQNNNLQLPYSLLEQMRQRTGFRRSSPGEHSSPPVLRP